MWIGLSDETIEDMNKMAKEKERVKGKREVWQCARCGKCCKFIVVPVMEAIDIETESYLKAHRIAYDGKKVIIPAVCKYLKKGDLRGNKGEYYCTIHNVKFANCRLGGEKECQEAQKAWALLNSE